MTPQRPRLRHAFARALAGLAALGFALPVLGAAKSPWRSNYFPNVELRIPPPAFPLRTRSSRIWP